MKRNDVVFMNKDLSADFESAPILFEHTTLFSVIMNFLGASPKGTMNVYVSNDTSDDPSNVQYWQFLYNSDLPVNAADNTLNYWYVDFPFKWAKLVWVKGVGSVGTCIAHRNSPAPVID